MIKDIVISRQVFRLAAAMAVVSEGGFGLIYLAHGRHGIAAIYGITLLLCVAAFARAQRNGRFDDGVKWLSGLLFAQMSLITWMQAGMPVTKKA